MKNRIYARITRKDAENNHWTYKKTDKQGYDIFVSPSKKYKVGFFPHTIYGNVIKNKWYFRP